MSPTRHEILCATICGLWLCGALLAETAREPVSRREVLLRAARNHTAARQFDKAFDYYREYLAAWPEDVAIAAEYGGVLIQAGQLDEAIAILTAAIEKQPDSAEAYRLLADAHAMKKDFAAAAAVLEKAAARFPQDSAFRQKLAQVLAWSGRYEDSIRQYRMLLLERPDDVMLMKGMLQVMQWARMYDAFLVESERFLAKHPKELDIRMERVELLRAKGTPEAFTAAVQECREILKANPDHALARTRLAQFLAWLGEWEQARKEYEAALAFRPEDAPLRREYAQLLLWTAKYAEAVNIYRKLQTDFPGDEHLAREYLDAAARVRPMASVERAWVQEFYRNNFLAGKPLQPATLAALGRALKTADAPSEAAAVFEAAVKAAPENLNLRLEYADLLAAMGRAAEAEEQYKFLLNRTGKTAAEEHKP